MNNSETLTVITRLFKIIFARNFNYKSSCQVLGNLMKTGTVIKCNYMCVNNT